MTISTRSLTCILALALLGNSPSMAAAFPGAGKLLRLSQTLGPGGRYHVTGRLLVQPAAGVEAQAVVAEAIARSGAAGRVVREIGRTGVAVVDVAPSALERVRAALAADPRVRFVERDEIVAPAVLPNDAYYASEPHLASIDAAAAWDVTTGADDPIAILDTGVDATHPDLAARVLPGRNVFDGNGDTADVSGHGTLVAGTVAAVTDNGLGVSGVTWRNPILPVRITDTDSMATYSTIADGLVWAADQGARIANVSFAVFGAHAVDAAAQYFVNQGGLVFAAGGNDGLRHSDPANDWVISVAATGTNGERADFSSFGAYIDLAAPGVDILTTTNGGGYARVSGTSFSSPIAAGVAALVFAANPSLSPPQVEALLEANATDIGEPGDDPYNGWGRVDAGRAVLAAQSMGRHEDTVPPFVTLVSPLGGATIGSVVAVEVDAMDDSGVVAVALYVDGREIARSESAPYAFSWDTTGISNGAYEIVARAWDAAGNVGLSETVTVSVENRLDRAAPRVRLRVRHGHATRSAPVRLMVHAADDVGVTSIRLYVNRSMIAVRSGTSLRSLDASWDVHALADGRYEILALAGDASGRTGRDRAIVTVRGGMLTAR